MAFFPPEYKTFPYREGDVVADRGGDRWGLTRILKVDRIDVPQGGSIEIAGQSFTAPEDDHLLVVACALGESDYATTADARAAFEGGGWRPEIGHAPMRAIFLSGEHHLVAHAPVAGAELDGYRDWLARFRAGEAGIF